MQPSAHHFAIKPKNRYRLGGSVIGSTENSKLRVQRFCAAPRSLKASASEQFGGLSLPFEVIARGSEEY